MKPDEEKKIPEAGEAKPGETLPEEALEGASGGSDETAGGPDVKDESNSDIWQRVIGIRWDR
ncbi:MAG: hypothetical protein IK082_06590 [Oscillospiraceae bacterium]|nr:hypothetical protein [Oscillospiraceae bacterium]